MPHHYDPNQPRVPKGHSNGGEWTRGGRDPVRMTDFSAARLRPSLRFIESPRGEGGGGPVRAPANTSQKAIDTIAQKLVDDARQRRLAEGLAVFAAASALNGPDRKAVLTIEAHSYPVTGKLVLDLVKVEVLSRAEVNAICKKFGKVQKLTNKAADFVKSTGPQVSQSVYGTKVHYALKEAIEAKPGLGLRTEVSVQKTLEETGRDPLADVKIDADRLRRTRYGQVNSIRIDVLERVNDTVCVYDIKTGRPMSHRRADDIAQSVFDAYQENPPKNFIVVEVRPGGEVPGETGQATK